MNVPTIGTRIRHIRGKVSRSIFAEKLGIGKTTLQRYENDERLPDMEFFVKLQDITSYSLDYLIFGKEMMLPTNEALILEKYRQADEVIKHKILLLLLEGSSATQNVVNQASNTGNGKQFNAKNQTIGGRNHNQTNNFHGGFGGDYINGDKK